MAARDFDAQEITRRAGEVEASVARWRRCFLETGADGASQDALWSARALAALCAEPTRADQPPGAAAEHWANLAGAEAGLSSLEVIQGIWAAHNLQPDGARQLLGNAQAIADICTIVDLYLRPPADAVVLSIDEKGQIPVTGHTRRDCAPAEGGLCDSGARDPERRPTTTLFCALNVHSGRVIGRCMQRQRVREFIRFLNAIKREIPPGMAVHGILDNYGPHRHPAVLRWLERHPRFAFHYTPAGMSWINLVEIYFARLTRECLRRHAVHCIIDLQIVINGYVARTNANPRPYVAALVPATYSLEEVGRKRCAFRRARSELP